MLRTASWPPRMNTSTSRMTSKRCRRTWRKWCRFGTRSTRSARCRPDTCPSGTLCTRPCPQRPRTCQQGKSRTLLHRYPGRPCLEGMQPKSSGHRRPRTCQGKRRCTKCSRSLVRTCLSGTSCSSGCTTLKRKTLRYTRPIGSCWCWMCGPWWRNRTPWHPHAAETSLARTANIGPGTRRSRNGQEGKPPPRRQWHWARSQQMHNRRTANQGSA
mmetsp:Transcript_94743/g.267472  ORF Transcript_94743/g.267472 Transcript_94743/m.267472 type:complete len:214 (-) Transcript_94743:807-1448(-)